MTARVDRWRSRIVRHADVDPATLTANPRNWRLHPQHQKTALAAVLDDVGWVSEVIVNERTGLVVDGHLRLTLALERHEEAVPVRYVDLDEREEALVLASLDPIAALADSDADALQRLIEELGEQDGAVADVLAGIAEEHGIDPPDFDPVSLEEQARLDQRAPVTCPKCGEEFRP
jgi:ParB-like chromosome segregation protein Spo0J